MSGWHSWVTLVGKGHAHPRHSLGKGWGTNREMLTGAELHQTLQRIQHPSLSRSQFNERNKCVLKIFWEYSTIPLLLKCHLRTDWFWAPGLLDNRNVHQNLLFLQPHWVLQGLLALRCFKDKFQTPFGLRLNLILWVSALPHLLHFPSCFTFPSFANLANILVFSTASSLWLSFRVQNWRLFTILWVLLEEFFVLPYKDAGADLKPMNDLAVEL